jgi:hypothetical protein
MIFVGTVGSGLSDYLVDSFVFIRITEPQIRIGMTIYRYL